MSIRVERGRSRLPRRQWRHKLMQLLLHLYATKTCISILICLTEKGNQGRMSKQKRKESMKWQERGDLGMPWSVMNYLCAHAWQAAAVLNETLLNPLAPSWLPTGILNHSIIACGYYRWRRRGNCHHSIMAKLVNFMINGNRELLVGAVWGGGGRLRLPTVHCRR